MKIVHQIQHSFPLDDGEVTIEKSKIQLLYWLKELIKLQLNILFRNLIRFGFPY